MFLYFVFLFTAVAVFLLMSYALGPVVKRLLTDFRAFRRIDWVERSDKLLFLGAVVLWLFALIEIVVLVEGALTCC